MTGATSSCIYHVRAGEVDGLTSAGSPPLSWGHPEDDDGRELADKLAASSLDRRAGPWPTRK